MTTQDVALSKTGPVLAERPPRAPSSLWLTLKPYLGSPLNAALTLAFLALLGAVSG